LGDNERFWSWPELPEWSEQNQDWVDMNAETRDLLARRAVCELEHATLARAPYRLNHVPEVKPMREELLMSPYRKSADSRRPGSSCRDDNQASHNA
jgi:hypothetical protein